MTRYRKFVVALLPFLIFVLTEVREALVTDNSITTDEWFALVITGVSAIGVYFFPNDPPAGEPAQPGVSERDV
jgi:hypothetical protein